MASHCGLPFLRLNGFKDRGAALELGPHDLNRIYLFHPDKAALCALERRHLRRRQYGDPRSGLQPCLRISAINRFRSSFCRSRSSALRRLGSANVASHSKERLSSPAIVSDMVARDRFAVSLICWYNGSLTRTAITGDLPAGRRDRPFPAGFFILMLPCIVLCYCVLTN